MKTMTPWCTCLFCKGCLRKVRRFITGAEPLSLFQFLFFISFFFPFQNNKDQYKVKKKVEEK